MADITPEQAALLQVRLANEHRLTLQQIAQLTIIDLNNLFRILQDEDDYVFAKAIRQTVPKIVESYTPNALVVATGYYQDARSLYELSGQLSKKTANFVPDSTEFLKTEKPAQITEQLIDDSFYHFNKSLESGNRQQAVDDIKQLSEDAIFQTSRQTIQVHSEADNAAENTPRRNVTNNGCTFCKTMAFHSGVHENNFHHFDKETGKRVKTFHKKCGCVECPAFRDELVAVPEWADKYEDNFNAARDEIVAYNSTLTSKKVPYIHERYSESKGRIVREKRFQTLWTDADGNPAEPIAINDKNIINGIRRIDYAGN